jgi:hypothetical protein
MRFAGPSRSEIYSPVSMGSIASVRPSMAVIRTTCPRPTGTSLRAFQISLPTRTRPSGEQLSSTSARAPISASAPVWIR